MPELPEVETIVKELRGCIVGKSIVLIEELYQGTLVKLKAEPLDYPFVIEKISRRGKYIIITTDRISLVIHLRMTGKLIHECSQGVAKHTRAIIHFSDGAKLLFDDIRTFGKMYILPEDSPTFLEVKLGPEPFSSEFNIDYLSKTFKRLKTSIKSALLNQKIVAGLGNIYVCEILYRAEISPFKRVSLLTEDELIRLIRITKEVLTQAIACNGTTISDYRRVDDKSGEFQNCLAVYGKKTCPIGHNIMRVKTCGRSTFYCPECQGEE